jgi:hypothetical protein
MKLLVDPAPRTAICCHFGFFAICLSSGSTNAPGIIGKNIKTIPTNAVVRKDGSKLIICAQE